MNGFKIIIVTAWMLLVPVLPLLAQNPMQVLILNSYSPDFYFTQGEVAGIKDGLNARNNNIVYTTEYMGRPRILEADNTVFDQKYSELFKVKIIDSKKKFDAIFVTDDPALEFMIKIHGRYFPGVPVVFCGINHYDPGIMEDKKELFGGILEQVDYLGTLDIAFKLHPGAKRFYILGDPRKVSQDQKMKIREIESRIPVEFVYLDDLSFEQLAETLQSLSDSDIVFRLAFYTDITGNRMTFNETMNFLEENVKVPIYSFWKGVLGKGGIIGGKLLSAYHHGREAVEKFYTTDKDQKYDVKGGNNPYFFDYNQLVRFGIDPHRLPPGSQVINQPFSFYETYKAIVLTTAAFFAGLVLILVALLVNIRKRKRAEQFLINARSALETINAQLESRVAQRTLELRKEKEKAEAANQAKSEFISNMSHELRTPLNGVLGYSQILQSNETDPKRSRYLASIQASGNVLLSIINDILDLSKMESGELELAYAAVDLTFFFKELDLLFSGPARDKGLEFTIQCDPMVPSSLILDKVRLRQVCVNLIGNAVKYTDEGYVRLNLACEQPEDRSASRFDLILTVADSGIGIEKKLQKIIFEPFKQIQKRKVADKMGTGLGLSITSRLVTMMGGVIAVASAPQKGSVFTVRLPKVEVASLTVSPEENGFSETDATGVEFKPARLLVVDDIEYNRDILITFLEPFGFDFDEAEDGVKALEMVEMRQPDLILLDMKMPAMDGYEVIRHMKSSDRFNRIPIVAVTASALKQDELEISRACDGYLRKPVKRKYLIRELMRFLPHTRADAIEPPEPVDTGGVKESERMTDRETASGLAALPPDLVRALDKAAAIGHARGVTDIAKEIKMTHPKLAFQIEEAVAQFEFERIIQWLK